ncbi:MAG: tRNA (guanine-N7)-methyltransferase [Deinococcales bacterium]|nr:tRNA (guanine-N7)-methyltransferase [Deinococcales bacterium]
MSDRASTHPDAAPAPEAALPSHASPLLAWRTLPFPAPWDAVFEQTGPLVVEVGFGDGRFTVRRAKAEPGSRFVGLEVSSGSLQRALRRVKREGVGNVRLAKTGAHVALRQLFAPASVDALVVNFPCPWPKERHAKHRLLQRSFFELAGSRLREGGELRLATDHPDYLGFALAEGAASGLYDTLRPPAPPDVFETKYALKWREQGKPLHYVVFRRNAVPAPAIDPWERPTIMPHALLRGTLPAKAPFDKRVDRYAEGHVILHELAAVLGGEDGAGRWLVRATVEEPDLRQQLLVLAQQRTPDEVIVRLESFGDPLITPTTRGCVHAVTEWLLAATDLSVTARNY